MLWTIPFIFCNYDDDSYWNDGSCSKRDSECNDGKLGCDCGGVCNGTAVIDCAGECGGSAVNDECGVCAGDGPLDGLDCDGHPLSFEEKLLPDVYSISNIYPNPFNPVTHIQYSVPKNTDIRIAVYNILGQRTDYLVNNFQTQGYYSIRWDASRYPSGLYFITMEAGQFRETRKVLMIK